jgi:hypothetical protein
VLFFLNSKEIDLTGRIVKAYGFVKRKRGVWLLAETGLARKGKKYPKSFFSEITFLRLLRFVFFLTLSMFVVYIYFLYLMGDLLKTILGIWSSYKQGIISVSILLFYSVSIYQLGVWRGRRG